MAGVEESTAQGGAECGVVNSSAPVIPVSEQLACVAREIAMRERVYPNLINSKRMTAGKAEAELAAMRAVQRTLQWLQANETRIKSKVEIITRVESEAAFRAALEAFPEAQLTHVTETGEQPDDQE